MRIWLQRKCYQTAVHPTCLINLTLTTSALVTAGGDRSSDMLFEAYYSISGSLSINNTCVCGDGMMSEMMKMMMIDNACGQVVTQCFLPVLIAKSYVLLGHLHILPSRPPEQLPSQTQSRPNDAGECRHSDCSDMPTKHRKTRIYGFDGRKSESEKELIHTSKDMALAKLAYIDHVNFPR